MLIGIAHEHGSLSIKFRHNIIARNCTLFVIKVTLNSAKGIRVTAGRRGKKTTVLKKIKLLLNRMGYRMQKHGKYFYIL